VQQNGENSGPARAQAREPAGAAKKNRILSQRDRVIASLIVLPEGPGRRPKR
jgi:hypothetical protein